MNSDCEECRRLWREYAVITSAGIHLQSKIRYAVLDDDIDQVAVQLAALTPELEAAETRRAASREAIRQHIRTAHQNAVSA